MTWRVAGLAVGMTLLLASCAGRKPDVSGLEPACARQCLGILSNCQSTARGIVPVNACWSTFESCKGTCPAVEPRAAR